MDVVESAVEGSPRFSWRATWVLGILGVVSLVGGLLLAVAGDHSTGQLVTAAAAMVGSVGALGLAMGLYGGRASLIPWARIALVVLALIGIAHSVLVLGSGTIWIPLDALAAVWALLAKDGMPQRRGNLRLGGRLAGRLAGVALVTLVVLTEASGPLGTAASELTKPGPDPNAVIVVENQSPRTVIVIAGSILATRGDSSFVGACGGTASVQIVPADYESDGRLMVFVAIDESGALDAWAAMSPAPSDLYTGSYGITPIWSRGDLAGTLPLHLVVHPDFSVDTVATSSAPCTPNPGALPAGS